MTLRGALKIGAGILLCGLLVYQIDTKEVVEAFRGGSYFEMSLAFTAFTVFMMMLAFRFHYVILQYSPGLSYSFRALLISIFFNNFLPSGIGGDLYKAHFLKRYTDNWSRAFTLIIAERLLSVSVLGILFMIYVLFSHQRLAGITDLVSVDFQPKYLVIALAVVFVILAVYFLRKGVRRSIDGLIQIYRDSKAALTELTKVQYMTLVLLSVLLHMCMMTVYFFLIRSLGSEIIWYDAIMILAIIVFVSLLPLSIGALGLLEGAVVLTLSFFGVSSAPAFAVAILNRLFIWLYAAIGGLLFIFERRHA